MPLLILELDALPVGMVIEDNTLLLRHQIRLTCL